MPRCGCCPGGLRGFLTLKLGRCPRCMRLAAIGTAGGGSLALAAHGIGVAPALVVLAVVATAPFALLLAAHARAFLRAAPQRVSLDRRAFVAAGMLAFIAVLLGAPVPAWAKDNPGSCKYDKTNDKCDPKDCGKIYDDQGKQVTLTCTKLTVDGTTDCYCVYGTADTCNDGKGNCTEVRKCPDLYLSPKKRNALVKKCLKDGTTCYCVYTKK